MSHVRFNNGSRPVVLTLTLEQARILWDWAYDNNPKPTPHVKAVARYVLPDIIPPMEITHENHSV